GYYLITKLNLKKHLLPHKAKPI
ncbi:Molybdopterin molybdenumtransferase, partial [Haemophilus influenzae]